MNTIHRHVRPALRALLVAAVVSGILAAGANPAPAAGKRKYYSASITCTSVAPNTCTFGGNTLTFTITITNLVASQQSLGSANITIPAGFAFVSFGTQTPPPGKTWLPPALAGNVVQLRNPGPSDTNALAPGQSISVQVTVVTACPPNTPYTWVTQAKQSNDFSGTGNNFVRVGSDPIATVTVGCPAQLAFGQQPTTTLAGQHINASTNPVGITVLIEDSAGQLVTNSTLPVTMALGSGPGTLYGTLTVNAVGGVASFFDLAIDLAGAYTLVASGSGLTSATSDSFAITGFSGKCDQSPCGAATGFHANQTDVTVGTVSVPVGTCLSVCFVSLDESTGDFCDGTCTGNTVVFAPPSNQDGVATLTIEIYKGILPGNLNDVHIFKLADDGVTVTELFDCSSSPVPCVSDRSHIPGGNGQFTVQLGFGDPVIGTR